MHGKHDVNQPCIHRSGEAERFCLLAEDLAGSTNSEECRVRAAIIPFVESIEVSFSLASDPEGQKVCTPLTPNSANRTTGFVY